MKRQDKYFWGITVGLFTIAILFTIPMMAGWYLDVKWNRYVLTTMVVMSYVLGITSYYMMENKSK